jgi:divalent metal cation (Fe/Co/Zn/Cd) transporter
MSSGLNSRVRHLPKRLGSNEESVGATHLFFGALALSMAVGVAGHSALLLQAGLSLNRVNPFGLVAAVISLLVGESEISASSAIARWVFPASGGGGLEPKSAPAVISFIVLVGVLGSVAHLESFDPLAALLIAGLVFRTGWRMIVEAEF